MKALYILSWDEMAGKSTLCAGIGRHLQNSGRKIGYLKPLALAWEGTPPIDKDAQFMKQALSLEEPVEALAPLKVKPFSIEFPAMSSAYAQLTKQAPTLEEPAEITSHLRVTPHSLIEEDFADKLKQACDRVSAGKDVMLLEGWGGLDGNDELERASCQIAELVDARVILVLRYRSNLKWEDIAPTADRFGERLLGVVVNHVPAAKLESLSTQISSLFPEEEVKILGILPEDRGLLAASLAELAEHLKATVVCCPEGLDELAENVMVGALCVDPGKDYFARKDNKVVISRAERPDMQLAALSTSTRGLVLTGDTSPIPQVLFMAEEKGVPILSTSQDTLSAIAGVEEALADTRFQHQKKLDRLEESLAKHFHFEKLHRELD